MQPAQVKRPAWTESPHAVVPLHKKGHSTHRHWLRTNTTSTFSRGLSHTLTHSHNTHAHSPTHTHSRVSLSTVQRVFVPSFLVGLPCRSSSFLPRGLSLWLRVFFGLVTDCDC